MENTIDDVEQRVRDDLEDAREALGARVREIRETVSNYVAAHPLASVGIAFGAGYVVSGALFSRTTFKAASIGGRFALGGLFKQLVAGIAPAILAAALSRRGDDSEGETTGGNGSRDRSEQH